MAPASATFRFYAELNGHLPPTSRFRPLRKEFLLPASVKDMIESFGVPHPEVDLVLVNGDSSDFSRLIRDADQVSVYPVFESLDITPALRLRPMPLREPKFVLDVHLGRLAAFLRMLGFNTLYENYAADPELVRISSEQDRILLTRDRGLLKHSAITRGYWLRATNSHLQAAEVVERFDLARAIRPFTRCMVCNHPLRPLEKEQARERVPRGAFELHEKFRECPGCGRVYWEGTHTLRMRHRIEQLIDSPRAASASAPDQPAVDTAGL